MSENPSLSPSQYHASSRLLHWIMAGLILYMIFQGWSLEEKDTMRATRYMIHKSIGITILALVLVRIGLRLIYKAPAELPMPKYQAMAAKAAHFGFYALMIGLPLSGWATVSTSELGRPTILYNLINLPHLPLPKAWHELYEEAHHLGAKLIIYGLVPLHIGAAIYHHFKTKDETLGRMIKGLSPQDGLLKQMRVLWIPLLVLILPLLLASTLFKGTKIDDTQEAAVSQSKSADQDKSLISQDLATSSANESSSNASAAANSESVATPFIWQLSPSDVNIEFQTAYLGEAINGQLAMQKAEIIFDPKALDQSQIKISIGLKSVKTGDKDRDETLMGADFFDTLNHPVAQFEAKRIIVTGVDTYRAYGHLTLKGKKLAHVLNFQLKLKDDKASMSAISTIDRLAYGIGTGEFADTKTIPADVTVQIKLKAKRR